MPTKNGSLRDAVVAYLQQWSGDALPLPDPVYFDADASVVAQQYIDYELPKGVQVGFGQVACPRQPVVVSSNGGTHTEIYTLLCSAFLRKDRVSSDALQSYVEGFQSDVVGGLDKRRTVLWDLMASGTTSDIVTTNFIDVRVGEHSTEFTADMDAAIVVWTVDVLLTRERDS